MPFRAIFLRKWGKWSDKEITLKFDIDGLRTYNA